MEEKEGNCGFTELQILIDVSKKRNVLMYILLFQNTKQVIKVTTLLNYLKNMDRNVILSH